MSPLLPPLTKTAQLKRNENLKTNITQTLTQSPQQNVSRLNPTKYKKDNIP